MLIAKNRISVLDGFRCIAVMMVVFFHYTTIYPKNHISGIKDNYISYWNDGHLGVQLFFMISGFVIYMTMERCKTVKDFFIKRFIRLMPMLFLASLITFIFPYIIDANNQYPFFHRPIRSFFPSLTFTDLSISKLIFHQETEYIDSAYWSLGTEMKFYIFAAAIFFFNKEKFVVNWFVFAFFSIIVYAASIYLGNSTLEKVLEKTIISNHILYFTLGIYFYNLFEKKLIHKRYTVYILILLFIQARFIMEFREVLYVIIFILLFLVFIFKQRYLSVLSNPVVATIGVISYPLYLLHQNIGKLLINKITSYFKIFEVSWWPIIVVVSTITILSYLLHSFYEIPIGKFLKKAFLPSKINS